MIIIAVKTIWQGRVGVRDRYVAEAKQAGEGLIIVHGQERMVIPSSQLEERIVGQSQKPFVDRFGHDPHHLIYFNWKPEAEQSRLKIGG